jgi:DNA-binding transcriptional LysR family regulator
MNSTLARLRKLFDDPLLIRDGRELMATPRAESLVKPISEVLDGVAAILAGRTDFDLTRAERTFAVTASDYTMITFLTPLLAQLEQEAPGLRLWVSPPGNDYEERLRRQQLDLLLIPREVLVSGFGSGESGTPGGSNIASCLGRRTEALSNGENVAILTTSVEVSGSYSNFADVRKRVDRLTI